MLNEEQQHAKLEIMQHLVGKNKFKTLRLDSSGGTGKTYTLNNALRDLSLQGIIPAVMTTTGRAASHLNKSGIPANTFHAIMFQGITDEEGNLIRWDKRSDEEIREAVKYGIIVDECSMMNKYVYDILTGFDVPFIGTGDYMQLGSIPHEDYVHDPTHRNFSYMTDVDADVDVKLTINHRFGDDSGIGTIARHLRENVNLPRMRREDLIMGNKNRSLNIGFFENNQFDAVICGTNATAMRATTLIREAYGYNGNIPNIGERVMCTANGIVNNRRISNGELFTVELTIPITDKETQFTLLTEDGSERIIVRVLNETWVDQNTPIPKNRTDLAQFTYGWAMTVHKSQGSTFSRVLFIDEDVSYFLDQQRFRYTACSRASDFLYVLS